MDWRRPEDYRFAPGLDAAGWAWQFLRRCAEYRADHAWFKETWLQLEAAYGAPPARDFFRWKQDPRAWRAESEIAGCGADACPGENDRILIECWMGAKWGFRKFPVDPAVDLPPDLAWRETPVAAEPLTAEQVGAQTPERVALGFDLGLPLDVQLDAARRRLAALRHGLAQAAVLPPLSIQQAVPIWTGWLRLLDGLEAGAALEAIGAELALADPAKAAASARAMSAGGYRRILLLPK